MPVAAGVDALTQPVALVAWAAAAQEDQGRQAIKLLGRLILAAAVVQMGMRYMEHRSPVDQG